MYIIFRSETLEDIKKSDEVLQKNAICLIKDTGECLIGDGISKISECKKLEKFPEAIYLAKGRPPVIFAIDKKDIPGYEEDS